MNLKKVYPLFTVLIFLVASCDKVKEAATIDIESSEKITFDVGLKAGESVSFSDEYNLSDNADIKNYIDRLKGVEITEAYYILKAFSASSSETASLSFTLAGEAFGPYNHNLVDDAKTAKTTLDAAKLNSVAAKLSSDKKIAVAIQGSHSITSGQEGVIVELHLKFKFTASAL